MPGRPGHAEPGAPATVVEFLVGVTGDPDGIARRVAEGEVVLGDGTRVDTATAYVPGGVVYLYRDLVEEPEVPGELTVLLHDERTGLMAVDKPPFLATMPRGGHVAQTAVVRVRRELDLPDLVPVHRLDRLTSGVLLLTTRPDVRAAYQRLVQEGGLAKAYAALAPLPDGLDLPLLVRNRIVKERGSLQAQVVVGEPNAETLVELEDVVSPGVGRYRLTPRTGRTHQLRLHLAGLGIPIFGDPLYPVLREVAVDDWSTPLQLLAREVSFTDPVSGEPRRITSPRSLPIPPEGDAWPRQAVHHRGSRGGH
ncbi:pseudouridine synthase [Ornithinimicrobium humiphilum]|uniref:RNA pseudouridylate synthase n=1 Tax=Ornithinimicrobium humiphilum TaxID=125288 RepID=A0A543KLY3_9MICO|nr:pseudouridine synthase [Ornithinimicrobium humiphilum]TQM96076.1 tRNA pseudouridine32 synthase/23S rRNA pseudouridine746 synthase [Ornithinimicrobium humiphilum]